MIKHLLKLVWNRKRINFLITVEIFFSFLILFAVMLFAVYYTDNYRQPLGFKYENVWQINIDTKTPQGREAPELMSIYEQLLLAVKGCEEVDMVAGVTNTPYSRNHWNSGQQINGRHIMYGLNSVTDEFKEVMGLELVRGRWFDKDDDGANWEPIVINQKLSRDRFGDEDPIGKNFAEPDDKRNLRVIGVMTDFRQDGEFSGLDGYLFERMNLKTRREPPQNLVIRLRPGTTAAFEEKLQRRIQAIAKDWSFEIEPLSSLREVALKIYLAPILAAALVAAFLMLMVALGLTGVLWQNVTQRTKEIGLRRAKGATAKKIYQQILGELLLIASFGLALGIAIIIQFPLLDLIGFISTKVYLASLVLSLALIYLMTILCGLYPSWLATKVQPAEALHYE